MKYLLTIFALLATILLLGPLAAAQQPAPELAKFAKLLGNWEGKGTAAMQPGAPPMEWTSRSTFTKILDGHFLQEDMSVEMGMPTPMVWRTIYGWDAASQQIRHLTVSNTGETSSGVTYWADANTLVGSATTEQQGQIVTERHVAHYEGDTFTIRIDHAVGGGDFFVFVEGTYKKGGDEFVALEAGQAAMGPPASQLAAFKPTVGTWKLQGKMTPAPGAPATEISGKEDIRLIMGGHAVLTELIGDPNPEFPGTYRALYYQGWDASQSAIVGFWATNMGELAFDKTHVLDGGTFVTVFSGLYQGQPAAQRSIMQPTDDGGFHLQNWSMLGVGKPGLSFEGKMTRMQE